MVERVRNNTGEERNSFRGKNKELLSALRDDNFEKFFDSYKIFDEFGFLVSKSKKALIYSGHVALDAEVSGELHEKFYESLLNSIKSIIGEDVFERIMGIYFEEKAYLLSNERKKHDGDPFLDDKFQTFLMGDNTVAQIIERRNSFNNVEFHYIVYPECILSFINELCKEHNIKI